MWVRGTNVEGLKMVRVKKAVADKRKELALNMVKNLEPISELDEDPHTREAALIIIKALERTAYGGRSRSAFTSES